MSSLGTLGAHHATRAVCTGYAMAANVLATDSGPMPDTVPDISNPLHPGAAQSSYGSGQSTGGLAAADPEVQQWVAGSAEDRGTRGLHSTAAAGALQDRCRVTARRLIVTIRGCLAVGMESRRSKMGSCNVGACDHSEMKGRQCS